MEITVRGTHRVETFPERAVLHLRSSFEGTAKEEVFAATLAAANELVAAIGALGEATTWHSVGAITSSSWNPHSDTGQVLPTRWQAATEIEVRFADFAALATFASREGRRPGVTLGWVEWDLTEGTRRDAEADALAGAVANALERAQGVARAAGGGAVVPTELADPGLLRGVAPDGGPGEPRMVAMSRANEGAPADLDPEHVQLKPAHVITEATVHARFTC